MLLLFWLKSAQFYAPEIRPGADSADFILPSTSTPNVLVTLSAEETILCWKKKGGGEPH